MILIKNSQRKIKINENEVRASIKKILNLLNYNDFDISIWFTTNKTIQKFNNTFRKKNKATDILSFPFHTEIKQGQKIKPKSDDDKNLGDIIISLEFCKKDSQEAIIPFNKYLIRIIIHGISHLLGYDHITDKEFKKMHLIEKKLLNFLSIQIDI